MLKPSRQRPVSIDLLKRLKYITVGFVNEGGKVEKHRVNVLKELSVRDANLSIQIQEHAQQIFFWNHARQRTIIALRKEEEKYRRLYNRYFLAYYEKLKEEDRYVSEARIKADAESHETVEEQNDRVLKYRDYLSVLTALCDGLEHRRSMLIQRSQNQA